MGVLPRHLGAAQDQTFRGGPGLGSVGCTLELGASVLVCGDGACPGGLQLRSGTVGRIITGCPLCSPPGGLCGLINVDVDAAARGWLLGRFPGV